MIKVLIILIAAFGESYFFYKSSSDSKIEFSKGSIPTDVINEEMKSSLRNIYDNAQFGYKIIKSGDNYFLHAGCTFDVYLIGQGGKLDNLYKLNNKGYTCGNYFFERDHKFYSLFGNGLWNGHADLLSLDSALGSWEFEFTENQPIDYHTSHVFQTPEGFLALFGSRLNPRKKLNQVEQNGYFLDWNKKKWVEVSFNLKGDFVDYDFHSKVSRQSIESANYFLFTNDEELDKKGWFIVDKNTLQIRFLKKGNFDFFSSPFLSVVDDRIFFVRPSGEYFELDLNTEFNHGSPIGEILIQYESDGLSDIIFKTEKMYSILLTLLGIVTLIIIIYFIKRYSKLNSLRRERSSSDISFQNGYSLPSNSGIIKDSGIEKYLDKLVKLESEALSTEEMDIILEIHDIPSFDNKRSKRAKIIKEINQYYLNVFGFTLIERVKSEEDKRFICYKIDERFKSSPSN
jgi:hypothetical protein